jgi:hypothetical protein
MNPLRSSFLLGALLLLAAPAQGQQGSSLRTGGYLKNMQSAILPGDDLVFMENLIHHRLNIRWDILPDLRFHAGIRNRVFAGNLTTLNPNFGRDLMAISDDWLPLSILWMDRTSYAVHSTLDRLYLDYRIDKLQIRAGRQRINWGVNLAFNPNDLFNAYNFLDFDYEERPGADALRVQYYYDFASGLDLVYNPGNGIEQGGAALRWFFNAREYDLQLIGGLVRGDLALGGGWSGYVRDAGWKGELTWFRPVDGSERAQAFSASTGLDYSFGKGWIIYGSYLYNSDVPDAQSGLLNQTGVLTARNLFPFEHNVLGQISYPVNPLLTLSAAFIYSLDDTHPLVLNPSLRLSLSENWDLDLIGQSFWPLASQGDPGRVSVVFLRVRWSY